MVTLNKLNGVSNQNLLEIFGTSRDQKPIGLYRCVPITNGSVYFEIDTSYVYVYDAENKIWRVVR